MSHERDQAMRAQEDTEAMIRMRDPDKAISRKPLLRFEDRMRIALGANMGFQVMPNEVEDVARMLVVLRQIDESCRKSPKGGGNLGTLVASAIKPYAS